MTCRRRQTPLTPVSPTGARQPRGWRRLGPSGLFGNPIFIDQKSSVNPRRPSRDDHPCDDAPEVTTDDTDGTDKKHPRNPRNPWSKTRPGNSASYFQHLRANAAERASSATGTRLSAWQAKPTVKLPRRSAEAKGGCRFARAPSIGELCMSLLGIRLPNSVESLLEAQRGLDPVSTITVYEPKPNITSTLHSITRADHYVIASALDDSITC
jgi:hypothetical protein